ncbi:hypothetical protein SAMN04515647_0738 [Cohaesibacter sp. ES.047]|uniref:hypothetical protein n=1 Tax=Cohaesibacter sp. ES.047 TaxID=1798205 RepID=UPI000BB884FC|nr:hypothetical protein [Cohaesibacter sp. ES.047]SNY90569.1 hypothetical protein SAMN04515647_0738 [Cohaesibacter sp. ES.047]
MTARKSDSRTRGASKAAKTIDLTAEDVTEREAPETSEPSQDDPSSEAETRAPAEDDVVLADGDAPHDHEGEDGSGGTGGADAPSSSDDADQGDAPDSDSDDIVAAYARAETEAKSKANKEAQSDNRTDDGEKGSTPPPPPPASESTAPSKSGFGGGFAGGLLGGVAIVALGYLGLQQGLVPPPGDETRLVAQDEQLSALASDVALLKKELAEVPRVDAGSIQSEIDRVEGEVAALSDRLEGLLTPDADANPDAPVNEQVTNAALANLAQRVEELEALKERVETAQVNLDQLETETEAQRVLIEAKAAEQSNQIDQTIEQARSDILSSADRRINDVVTDLSNFQTEMKSATEQISTRVSSLEENNLSERMQSSARTIALAGLENAVASGADYSLALATFADVVGAHEGVTTLRQYASTGAPTKEQLAANFRNVYDKVLREAKDAGAATLIDKLLLNAQSLVKVKSLNGEKTGESLTSQLGVLEYHVEQGNLVKAAEVWDALPPEAKNAEAGADWIKGLKARIAVDAAMSDIRAEFGTDAMANAS